MQRFVDHMTGPFTTSTDAEAELRSMSERVIFLADEINQPLTAIANYCESARLVLGSMAENEQVQKVESALEAALDQVFRAAAKVRRLTESISHPDGRPDSLA